MRVITTDDITGNVEVDWRGGPGQSLQPVSGKTHRQVPDNEPDRMLQRWNGSSFSPQPVPVVALEDIPLTPRELRQMMADIAAIRSA